MRNSKNKRAGFGTLEVLAAGLIVTIFVAVGWVVYQQNRTKSTDAEAGNGQPTSQVPASAEPEPAVGYLEITEWGVKFPLGVSLKDAYYTLSGSNIGGDGRSNTAWLGLKSLDSQGCNIAGTGPTASAAPIGSIIRVQPTDTDPVAGVPYPQKYPNGVTLDGYYYVYLEWKDKTCASKAALQALDAAFAGAAKSASRASGASN